MAIQTEVSELILKADASQIDEAKKSLDALAKSAEDVSAASKALSQNLSPTQMGSFADASKSSAAALHEWRLGLDKTDTNTTRSIDLNSELADRLRKVGEEATKASSPIKNDLNAGLQNLVNASDNADKSMSRLGSMFENVKGFLGGLIEGFAKGGAEALGMASSMSVLASGFTAAVAAGGFFLKQLFDFVAPVAQFAEDAGKMAARLGMATEAYTAMKPALDDAGIGIRTFSRGLVEMQQSIDKIGTEKGAELENLFKSLGISVEALKNMNADQKFTEIAEAISKIEDPAERVSAAIQIFGERLGPQLMPMLKEGKDGMRGWIDHAIETGQVVSDVEAKLADGLGDALKKTGDLFTSVKNNAVKPYIGELKNLAETIYDNLKKSGAFAAATGALKIGLGGILIVAKGLVSGLVIVATAFDVVGKSLAAVAAAMVHAGEGEFKKAWEALKFGAGDAVASVKKAGEDMKKIWKSVDEELVKSAGQLDKNYKKMSGSAQELHYWSDIANKGGVIPPDKIKAVQEYNDKVHKLRLQYDETYKKQSAFMQGVEELNFLLRDGAFGEGAAAQREYDRQIELLTVKIEKMDEPLKKVTESTKKLTQAQKEQIKEQKSWEAAMKAAEASWEQAKDEATAAYVRNLKARHAMDEEEEKRIEKLYKQADADEAAVKEMKIKNDLMLQGKNHQAEYNLAVLEGELASLDWAQATADDVVALERRIAAQKELIALSKGSVGGIDEQMQKSMNIISFKEQQLQARVVAGLVSEADARVELRRFIGEQADALNRNLVPAIEAAMAAAKDEEVIERLRAYLEEIRKLQEIGKQTTWTEGLKKGLESYAIASVDVFTEVKDATLNAFKGMEDALVEFVTTGKVAFSDLVESILSDLARIAIQKTITTPLANALGGLLTNILPGSSGAIQLAGPGGPGFFEASAQGNVFTGTTGLSDYANTVVKGPTVFEFAKGIGIMGEEPGTPGEAIMPLTRMSGGDLGVKVQGGGESQNVYVNIINNASGSKVEEKETVDSRGNRRIEVIVSDMVASEINRRGSGVNKAVGQAFNARPAFVGR